MWCNHQLFQLQQQLIDTWRPAATRSSLVEKYHHSIVSEEMPWNCSFGKQTEWMVSQVLAVLMWDRSVKRFISQQMLSSVLRFLPWIMVERGSSLWTVWDSLSQMTYDIMVLALIEQLQCVLDSPSTVIRCPRYVTQVWANCRWDRFCGHCLLDIYGGLHIIKSSIYCNKTETNGWCRLYKLSHSTPWNTPGLLSILV